MEEKQYQLTDQTIDEIIESLTAIRKDKEILEQLGGISIDLYVRREE